VLLTGDTVTVLKGVDVVVYAGIVEVADPQWKPTECTPMEQPGCAFFPGLKETLLAPPH